MPTATKERPLTYGSLFAGVGGMDLGFERAGMVCKWQVEINEYCQRVLAKHWPDVRRHDDVRTFPPGRRKEWRVDVICGGFPCKQTSNAAAVHGRRDGLDGKDSGLWYDMLRVVRFLCPYFVVVENVGGASTWKDEIKNGLATIGYFVPDEPVRLSAEMFGAPHIRKRLFWIADRYGKGLAIARQANALAADALARRASDGNAWLSTLAGIRRVDDGLPGGMDRRKRIEACGNAVCPAMSEWIGRRIVEAYEQSYGPTP